MKDSWNLYKRQYKKAKETLEILEKQKAQIEFDLKSNPICSTLHKDLRKINLDIKITVNELEHVASGIKKCELESNSLES